MKDPKILYISCHSILEFDELRMFRDLGYSFFSIGGYIDPEHPHSNSRPALQNCKVLKNAFSDFHLMCGKNKKNGIHEDLHSKLFTREFLDHFDVIIIMHIPNWITQNWNVLKGRNVIWRTIGQSTPHVEKILQTCRSEGLKIVRYSPKERSIPGFIGEDVIIRFGKYPIDFRDWKGSVPRVMTIGQSIRRRSYWCNYETIINSSRGFSLKIYGHNNFDIPSNLNGGELSYEQLSEVLSESKVYFYTGTKPASYTLNFIEAAMSGIPMVSIGKQLALFEGHDYFEIPDLFNLFKCGFYSDDSLKLNGFIENVINNENLAKDLSVSIKTMAMTLFNSELIKQQWKEFFNSL